MYVYTLSLLRTSSCPSWFSGWSLSHNLFLWGIWAGVEPCTWTNGCCQDRRLQVNVGAVVRVCLSECVRAKAVPSPQRLRCCLIVCLRNKSEVSGEIIYTRTPSSKWIIWGVFFSFLCVYAGMAVLFLRNVLGLHRGGVVIRQGSLMDLVTLGRSSKQKK